ncbi:Probable cyclic di-GMP phosphodiesterase VC_1348, partial [Durusdinium trenchii]
RILVVDNDPGVRDWLGNHLNEFGYGRFVSTSDSTNALDLIRQERPELILLDMVDADLSGLEILHVMRQDHRLRQLAVLAMVDKSDSDIRSTCLALGVTDLLTKPVDPAELQLRVRNGLLNRIYRDQLVSQEERLQRQVRERTADLAASRREVVFCLARAAEYRDDDTGQHVYRVGKYVGIVARELGFSESRIEMLELAAQLHDIGKIGIPDYILRKPGRLLPTEYEVMKHHCRIGKDIIRPAEYIWNSGTADYNHRQFASNGMANSSLLLTAAQIAQTHHEWWDGTGYPLGLKGEDIPIEGRMTAVADVFDALCSKRPYKQPYPHDRCFEILDEGSGTHFDPAVVEAFIARADEECERTAKAPSYGRSLVRSFRSCLDRCVPNAVESYGFGSAVRPVALTTTPARASLLTLPRRGAPTSLAATQRLVPPGFGPREQNADVNPLDELTRLTSLLPESEPLFELAEHIPASTTPEPYKQLLVHDHHMTVTMEQYHKSSVDVRVLDERLDGDIYARKILLTKAGTDIPVQFGIVRFNFHYVTQEVRNEILSGKIPLGRVLITHNVLRHIDLGAILRLTAGPGLADYLKMPVGAETYGRLATIFCNRQPAVDLLEVSSLLENLPE